MLGSPLLSRPHSLSCVKTLVRTAELFRAPDRLERSQLWGDLGLGVRGCGLGFCRGVLQILTSPEQEEAVTPWGPPPSAHCREEARNKCAVGKYTLPAGLRVSCHSPRAQCLWQALPKDATNCPVNEQVCSWLAGSFLRGRQDFQNLSEGPSLPPPCFLSSFGVSPLPRKFCMGLMEAEGSVSSSL